MNYDPFGQFTSVTKFKFNQPTMCDWQLQTQDSKESSTLPDLYQPCFKNASQESRRLYCRFIWLLLTHCCGSFFLPKLHIHGKTFLVFILFRCTGLHQAGLCSVWEIPNCWNAALCFKLFIKCLPNYNSVTAIKIMQSFKKFSHAQLLQTQ